LREKVLHVDCWCYLAKHVVMLEGKIVGKRQADLLQVTDCMEKKCIQRGEETCLIGKIREGRWP